MAALPSLQGNNLETTHLVWLDASINNSKENLDFQQQIRLIINHIQTFQNPRDCEEYIARCPKDDRIFLIVSGQLGREIVPRIHGYRQVFSIYVYCMNKAKNEEWARNFPKIKHVITDINTLLNQIQADQTIRIKNRVDEPIIINRSRSNPTVKDKSTKELNGEFLHSQLLIDCLLRLKPNPTNKLELINVCRKFYENNPQQLNLIKEFEDNYTSTKAIWWYTKDSFLYRLLNKALRIQNIDLLFLFRFIIYDIEQQLKQNQCTSTIRAYRGQLMSNDEINQLKTSIGEYISINSFFSTSLSRPAAIQFLNDYSFSFGLQKVLFEVEARPQTTNLKPFANITSLSLYSNEQEVLFMCDSVFRLKNIHQDATGLWIVELDLSNNHNDENFKALFNNIKSEYSGINEETSLLAFGNILHQAGKYDSAEKYFHRLLNELSEDHPDRSKCYHALGVLALIKNDYNASLMWHNKSLKLLKSNDPLIGDTYHCIGCINQKQGNARNALEYYCKALEIWRNNFGEDYNQIADCLNNMGCLYESDENYAQALDCHEKALAIRLKKLPKNHSDIGASYNNIGNIYFFLAQYDLALENYEQSYKIKCESLPAQHPSLASTLENIGLVYEKQGSYEEALTYYSEAAASFREAFSPEHSHVIEIEKSIKHILSLLNP